jgi:hypothetical protein
MNTSPQTKCAIGVSVAAVVVLIASFMPWGELRGTPNAPLGGALFQGMNLSLTMTAWNGNITILGLKIPNWLVVVAASAAALISWLKALSVWQAHIGLSVGLTVYGFLHACWVLVSLGASDDGSIGIGSLLTAAAFVAMVVLVVQEARSPRQESPNQSLNPTGNRPAS